jgi:hypothetical protein
MQLSVLKTNPLSVCRKKKLVARENSLNFDIFTKKRHFQTNITKLYKISYISGFHFDFILFFKIFEKLGWLKKIIFFRKTCF